MGQWITASKAVRLLGIKRGDLQRMIRDGELTSLDGAVDLDALRRVFPVLALRDDPVLERVEIIKATAFTRRVGHTVVPERDGLVSQLERRSAELSLQRAMARKYREILDDLIVILDTYRNGEDPARREVADDMNRWLAERLRR